MQIDFTRRVGELPAFETELTLLATGYPRESAGVAGRFAQYAPVITGFGCARNLPPAERGMCALLTRRIIVVVLAALLVGCMARNDANDAAPAVESSAPTVNSPPKAEATEPSCQTESITPQEEYVAISVFFTCGTGVAPGAKPVSRQVPRDEALRGAVLHLLSGPTDTEQDAGFRSFFSTQTAGMLNDISLTPDGHLVVDFKNYTQMMVNASTTAGATQLLNEIGKTVSQFAEVKLIEYRFDGSCEAFWKWLQADCQLQAAERYRD